MHEKHQINHLIRVASIGTFALILLLIIAQLFFPALMDDLKHSSVLGPSLVLALGACLSIIFFGYAYYSWRLDENSFLDWLMDQEAIAKNQKYSPKGTLWMFRIIGPVGFLFGLGITAAATYSLLKVLFG